MPAMEHQDFSLHIDAASPLEKYPAKQHARRVADFLGVEKGLIYLPGAPTAYLEDSDQFVPFRQRRYFYYLSGVDESDCHLTYDIRLDTLMLYVPAAGSARKVYYNGRGSTPQEALEKYDVDAVHWASAVADYVEFWMTQHEGDVYILHPDQAVVPGHDKSPRVNYTKLQTAIDAARVRKDQHEIKLVRRANEISAKAHANVLRNILKFKNEAQVEASFLDTCVAADAKHQAYEIIAASGENAATLHYIKNDEPFEDRQVMCLDAGCEWECYASDVTRTFPLSGQWPSKEAKEIYDLVLKIQTKCIEAVRPGARYLDIHYLAHRILIDGLLELGIFHNGTAQEIFDAGTSLAFLPHGLGHHLGLEVHDVSDVPLMASEPPSVSPVVDLEMCKVPVHPSSAALEEGMIVTIEPGIYFNRYALSAVYFPDPTHSKYINRNVLLRYISVGGVRIEDDILVTDDGYENLTTAPKGDEMLRLIQEGTNEALRDGVPKASLGESRPRTDPRRELHVASSEKLSRNKGIEAWSREVSSGHSETPSEMPVSSEAKRLVELEGHQTSPVTPQRSRPVSLSAAPASFEAIGWPTGEDSVAAELPSEPSDAPQPSEYLEHQASHWRKVPPALARMVSTRSLSSSSLPEYTPSQMFQRPRQAPVPPQKLPELPAKPLAYRQSMPIIISGSNAAKSSATRSPVVPRHKSMRDQIRPEPKARVPEDNFNKRHSSINAEIGSDSSQQEQDRHVTHRASIAIGEEYCQQLNHGNPEPRLQYNHFWQKIQKSQARQQETLQKLQRQQQDALQRTLVSQEEALRRQKEHQHHAMQMQPQVWNQTQQAHFQQQGQSTASPVPAFSHPMASEWARSQDHTKKLELLDEQNKKQLAMAHQQRQQPSAALAEEDYAMQLRLLEEQNQRRLALARQEQRQRQQQHEKRLSIARQHSQPSSIPTNYYDFLKQKYTFMEQHNRSHLTLQHPQLTDEQVEDLMKASCFLEEPCMRQRDMTQQKEQH